MSEPDALQALDLTNPPTLRELWNLQRAAYAVEARLIGYDGIPALHESQADLRDCGERFLGLRRNRTLVGAVSWASLPDDGTDLCRLVVSPSAMRTGVATALLDALDAEVRPTRTTVSTGTANRPALRLYRSRGFMPVSTQDIAPGMSITNLERITSPR